MQVILIQSFTDAERSALLAAAAASVGTSLEASACMQVILMRSFTDAERSALLAAAAAVVYTPTNEHFGIVPLEAMAAGRPVLACNSGGPTESVLHGRTGFLAEPVPVAFASAMAKLAVRLLSDTLMQQPNTTTCAAANLHIILVCHSNRLAANPHIMTVCHSDRLAAPTRLPCVGTARCCWWLAGCQALRVYGKACKGACGSDIQQGSIWQQVRWHSETASHRQELVAPNR